MLRLLVVFVAASCLLAAGCQKVELKEFSPDGTFKVLMPEKKEEKTQSTPVGPMKVWTSEFNDGGLWFAVMNNPLAAGGNEGLPAAVAEALLKEAQKESIEGYKGQLVSESVIKLADTFPGRQFEAKVKVQKKNGDGEVDGVIKGRVYLVNNKIYQLQAVGKPDWVNGEEIPKFLDSLQIVK